VARNPWLRAAAHAFAVTFVRNAPVNTGSTYDYNEKE
jgi:hypothetical protein